MKYEAPCRLPLEHPWYPETGKWQLLHPKFKIFGWSKVGKHRLAILNPVLGRSAEALVKGRFQHSSVGRDCAFLWLLEVLSEQQ